MRYLIHFICGLAGLALGVIWRADMRGGATAAASPEAGSGSGAAGTSRPVVAARPGPLTDFLRKAATMDAAGCEEAMAGLISTREAGYIQRVEVLLRRWLSLESPQVVREKLTAMKQTQKVFEWQEPFFRAWAAVDYAGAMAGTADDRNFDLERAIAAVRYRDPTFMKFTGLGPQTGGGLSEAFAAMAKSNPGLAKGIVERELPGADKGRLAAAVARGLAADDPAGTFAWLGSLGLTMEEAGPAYAEAFVAWCAKDRDAAMAACAKAGLDPGGFASQDRRLEEFVWLLKSPESASAQVRLASFDKPFLTLEELHTHLAKVNGTWDKGGSMISPAIDHDGWYDPDARGAAMAALDLAAGPARDALLRVLAAQWQADQPGEAERFAEAHGILLPKAAVGAELRAAAFANPQETFAPLFGSGEIPDRKVLSALALDWASTNPLAAAEWMLTIAANEDGDFGRTRDLLLENTIGYHFAKNDAIGVAEWVGSLPDGPAKSHAWMIARGQIAEYHPDLAFSLSLGIGQGEERMASLKAALEIVNRRVGYPAALEHLNSPELGEDERQVLAAELQSLRAKKGGAR